MKVNWRALFVWAGLYMLMLSVYNIALEDYQLSFIRLSPMFGFVVSIFYLNYWVLYDRWYAQKKVVYYVLSILLLICTGAYLSHLYITYFMSHVLCRSPEFDFHSNFLIFQMEILFNHALPILLSLYVSFLLKVSQERRRQEQTSLMQLEAESKFLKQQISPHFLFNTLNNIYSLSILQDQKASEAIMQLSKMLDYSLYGDKKGTVSLAQEIRCMESLIGLFKLKDSKLNNIHFSHHESQATDRLHSMLLLPFVENAFKHGNMDSDALGFLRIQLRSDANHIFFECQNTYFLEKCTDQTHGIGIQNISRRLDLLYPNRSELSIRNEEEKKLFTVKLKISKV